jgi:hypothetical protein
MEIGKSIEGILAASGVKNVAKAKTIVIGSAVVIGGIVIAIIAVRMIKNAKRRKEVRDVKSYDIIDRNDELAEIPVSQNNLTITDGNAILISQNLLAAMDRFGTDEKAIYYNLGLCKTKDDLLLVIKKFGTKPYTGTVLAEGWVNETLFSKSKNLNGWLRAELSKKELKPVTEIFEKLDVPF